MQPRACLFSAFSIFAFSIFAFSIFVIAGTVTAATAGWQRKISIASVNWVTDPTAKISQHHDDPLKHGSVY
jgi:hypothetical protein